MTRLSVERYVGALTVALTACSGVPGEETSARDEWDSAAESTPAATFEANRHSSVGSKLMIIGTISGVQVGNVTRDAIFTDRLITDLGGARHLRILVVPGASSAPAWLAGYLRALLASRGVAASQVELAHIASEDDEATPHVDESRWTNGAYDARTLAQLARANVVWFAGGDQNRLTRLLLRPSGNDTPFQQQIRARLRADNLLLVGYSAGAAVMSDPMIGNGSPLGALGLPPATDPDCGASEPLCVSPGLGYLPASDSVIVDQHFTQRGRFPRLIRALSVTGQRTGWGVGEHAAFYVDLGQRSAEVLGIPGEANVTIVGRTSAAANHEQATPPFLGDGYTVSVLGTGDTYSLPDASNPHGLSAHSEPTEVYPPFSAYYEEPPVFTDAFGNIVLSERITEYFADGTAQASGARVDSIAFRVNEQGDAKGFRVRFTSDDKSLVAWNEDLGYSLFDARVGFANITAKFSGLEP